MRVRPRPDRSSLSVQFDRDSAFFASHQQELAGNYPDQWVAIYDCEVAGANPSLEHLLADLRARGIPPGQAFVQFLATREATLIL